MKKKPYIQSNNTSPGIEFVEKVEENSAEEINLEENSGSDETQNQPTLEELKRQLAEQKKQLEQYQGQVDRGQARSPEEDRLLIAKKQAIESNDIDKINEINGQLDKLLGRGKESLDTAMKQKGRIAMHAQNPQSFPTRPGYHRHLFNDIDDGNRIKKAFLAGYRHVLGTCQTEKDGKAGYATQMGDVVNRHVGTDEEGKSIRGFLMEIPIEIWERDQKEKDAIADEEERKTAQEGIDRVTGAAELGASVTGPGIVIQHGSMDGIPVAQ